MAFLEATRLIADIQLLLGPHAGHVNDGLSFHAPNQNRPRWLLIINCLSSPDKIFYTLQGGTYTAAEVAAAKSWISSRAFLSNSQVPPSTATGPPQQPPPTGQSRGSSQNKTTRFSHSKKQCSAEGCHKLAATAIGASPSSSCHWSSSESPVCLEHCRLRSTAEGVHCRLSSHRQIRPETIPSQNIPPEPPLPSTPHKTPSSNRPSESGASKSKDAFVSKDSSHIPVLPSNFFDSLPTAQFSPNASTKTAAEARDFRKRQDQRRTISLFYFRASHNVSPLPPLIIYVCAYSLLSCLLADRSSNSKRELPG